MTKIRDTTSLIGKRFGALVVIADGGIEKTRGETLWLCLCDCGNKSLQRKGNLPLRRSCGCLKPKIAASRMTTHGWSDWPEHKAWKQLLERCLNQACRYFRYYGARGITVCQRWRESFIWFLVDVGPKPGPGYSIDRIDNDGNYEPGNVRWATQKEQMRNTRRCVHVTIDGVTHTLSEWAEISGINEMTFGQRVEYGWPECDLLQPTNIHRRHPQRNRRTMESA